MNSRVIITGLVVVAICVPGAAHNAIAGGHIEIGKHEISRTLGTYRYYGYPEYRCRAFSTVCGYIRPVYYGRYWSTTYTRPYDGRTDHDTSAKPRLYVAGDIPFSTRASVPMERSGGFTRVDGPGNASRWVRSDTLVKAQ